MIRHVLRPGGYWIHLGPLLWHWADSGLEEQSVELPLAELHRLARLMGFESLRQEFVDAAYIGGAQGSGERGAGRGARGAGARRARGAGRRCAQGAGAGGRGGRTGCPAPRGSAAAGRLKRGGSSSWRRAADRAFAAAVCSANAAALQTRRPSKPHSNA